MIFLLSAYFGYTQSCPDNIGFENGTLAGWNCYAGILDDAGINEIAWGDPIPPIPGRHTVLKNTSPQILDIYGHFPVNSPNGSDYSLLLGNSAVGGKGAAQCERMTYDFVVPTDDFTLIYYYAVVFQNPSDHDQNQQPKFIANVINLDNPNDTPCGSFSFTSSAGLAGFQRSNVGADVYFKSWSPLTIRLQGRKGKHFELEFITRDCSKGGHFGYAYVDFDENCVSPIKGNNYCAGVNNGVTLTGPAGFETYQWSGADGTVLSNAPTLKISPAPPDGTVYTLQIVPYYGLGCPNTFTTTVNMVNEPFVLKTVQNMSGCKSDGIDLTQASVTAGSSPGQKYEYYTDAAGQNFLSDPKRVTESGTYYIRGSNGFGCTDIAAVNLTLFDGPVVKVIQPLPVCEPTTVDLTKTVTTTDPGVTLAYYTDYTLKTKVTDPTAIGKTGYYYVAATAPLNVASCVTVTAVSITVNPLPVIKDLVINGCPPINLLNEIGNVYNIDGITYYFFYDAAHTLPAKNPDKITTGGTYYYYAANGNGCISNSATIDVTVYPVPFFKVTDPDPVVYPKTIDLSYTHIPLTFADFTYWKDSQATIALDNYQAVGESGTYYIKALNASGCSQINPVHVLINAPEHADVVANNTFTPNGDGINDYFVPTFKGIIKLNYLKIYNRNGQEIFDTTHTYNRWDGNVNGKPVPVGTYYWLFNCYDIYYKKVINVGGSVTIIR